MRFRIPSLAECSVLLLIVTLVVATLVLSRQEQHARTVTMQRTLDQASILAEITRAVHEQYADSTRGAHEAGQRWSADNTPAPGTIHYPATFSRLLTQRLAETLKDTRFRIYSSDPFTFSGESAFEREAIHALSHGDRERYWSVETWPGNIEVMRYAMPLRMTESCLSCHGGSSDLAASGDWTEGEVRGIWEVGIQLPQAALRSPPERAMLVGLVFLCSALGLVIVYPVVRHEVERRTQAEELSDDLLQLAETDPLSGLANRRAFDDALDHAVRTAGRDDMQMGLVVLDIDHFKAVNDTYGHDVGDTVIRDLGRIIRSQIRTCDFAARIGGEEFAVICPDVDEAELSRVSERIRAGIEGTAITSPSGTVRVTASAGACLLKAEEDPLGIYRRADRLLMKAKKAGRNMVCFAQSVTTLN